MPRGRFLACGEYSLNRTTLAAISSYLVKAFRGFSGVRLDKSLQNLAEASRALLNKAGLDERAEPLRDRFAKVFTVLFFAGGLVFDALTVGRDINLWKLAYVGIYALVIPTCIVVRERDLFNFNQRYVDWTLHFSLGALFSPLIIFYFRSAGHFWAFATVLLLGVAMIWNEIAARRGDNRELVWGLYGIGLVMFLNFLLPYLVGTVASWMFYTSVITGLGISGALYLYLDAPKKVLVGIAGFCSLLVGLYTAGAVPPVPLVMKQSRVCLNAEFKDGRYQCKTKKREFWAAWGLGRAELQYGPEDRVSVMSAVAAPPSVSLKLEHRWHHWSNGRWAQTDTIPMSLEGGRQLGWRFYSYKENVEPGAWYVQTALEDGPVLSSERFILESASKIVNENYRTYYLH
jgi:hypothetical protein